MDKIKIQSVALSNILTIRDIKDYNQNKLVTYILCRLKKEARGKYGKIKNETLTHILPDDYLLQYEVWTLSFDVVGERI